MMRNDATQRQIDAANPDANTWLSANAGSGKTRVLTDRVARLLLSGVAPQNVLCLTYTKAAASEMQNRLFQRLGEWAMLPDGKLRAELTELGIDAPDDLGRARRLFATAIETPGGLKVQTIHAFCASVLRRFPMEAGVSPDFKEMDDRSGRLLMTEIVEDMAQGPERPLVEALAAHHSGAEFEDLLREITGKRLGFMDAVDRDTIWGWFDLDPWMDSAVLEAQVYLPDDGQLIADLVPLLLGSGANDSKAGAKLSELSAPLGLADMPVLENVLLNGAKAKAGPFSAKLGSFPTKGLQNGAAAPLMDRLENLMRRVEQMRPVRLGLSAAKKSQVMHDFAHAFVQHYEARKAQRGWVDFDDLIQRTAALLNNSDVAQWVLFRLDGGIDHILVDEAQDTSPAQWQVIDSLAREFMSGEGAHAGRTWSIFVVGDPKQSIYSFQGADPVAFTGMRDKFNAGLEGVQRPLQQLPLQYSFRSAPVILEAVDTALRTMPGLGEVEPSHRAFHDSRPGRVDLWPMLEPVKDPEPRPWNDPVDLPSDEDHSVVLSNHIADQIAHLIEHEQIPHKDEWKPITPGDIIVLVQRRSDLFHHIIRACKARGLAIAGADRLRIGGEMAVKDLTALLRFLATSEDDLSLAAALRSPLFGWSEDDLFRLAHGRKGFLWAALRGGEHPKTLDMITDLRDQADYLRPYELIDRVLTRWDGRRRLIGQLTHEAEDGIDALLAQALSYEQMEVPSLTGFLAWLDTEDVEIKRQMDSSASEIRVMTVHGSKGLEAPVVILPDTAQRQYRGRGGLTDIDGHPIWKPRADDMPPVLTNVTEIEKTREIEERMRLLYVAMTRAESWLIVAGAGNAGKAPEESWHGIIEQGLIELGAASKNFATGQGLRLEGGDWPEAVQNDITDDSEAEIDLPRWITEHAPTAAEPPKPLTPSDLGGAKVLPGAPDAMDAETAKKRGRQIHRLLEFLPDYDPADWASYAEALLAFGEDAAEPAEVADLLTEARSVLTAPALAHLFTGEALAEVEISAPVSIAGRTRIHGIIDRLVITPERVIAVDFKSNHLIPERPEDIPEGILRQLGAYETALAPLFPGREIASAVLWTRTATLMDCPPGLALAAFARLDEGGPRSYVSPNATV